MDISPPDALNFAQHLFQVNAGRAGKVAYVDDRGRMSYGELEERSRRFAAALLALGIRREERVLLLMLDANEWPVAFLGCLYAGVVPVAVNTLLTADDYAYMLGHSRAQAAIVSAALAPQLVKAMGHSVASSISSSTRSSRRRPSASRAAAKRRDRSSSWP